VTLIKSKRGAATLPNCTKPGIKLKSSAVDFDGSDSTREMTLTSIFCKLNY